MLLVGDNIGKKFGKNWIFRNQNFELDQGNVVAITGKNGSGKSTLLQIMAGYLTPSEGKVLSNDTLLEEAQPSISFIGPYTEVIEEFTLRELLSFHQKFKNPIVEMKEMAESASLPLDKLIAEFSTGMKQRTKLITAFYFENDILFMDEPTANLDQEGFDWWSNELKKLSNKLILVASNDSNEINMCQKSINL
ncbi:ABC transporter ATP-binding protein [Ekhidna sp.]|uniref:ABC transporter ATP-binding protein n=1 Tax=Ekhidna sp. TaxID=2608089 RepID=UPI003CCBCF10